MSTGVEHEVTEVGKLRLKLDPEPDLKAGQVGYVVAGVKTVADARVGDTMAIAGREVLAAAVPGFRETQSMVFSGLYPIDAEQYESLEGSARAAAPERRLARRTSRRRRWRSASASAADSSACCTSRSSRSACAASSRST